MDLDFELHPAQLDIYKNDARFKVVAAGRRFGKSYLSCVTLLIEALKEENEFGYDLRNKEVWYIAPTFQQAKDIMWNLLKDLGRDVIESTVENVATCRLINGRTIKLKGSDRPDTLRGSGLSYVVLDEYAFMKPSVWEEIIFPTLADVKGSALFIGTPDGKNHFYDLYKESENDDTDEWKSWHFNTTDNPVLDPELIARAKKKMGSHAYKKEFEASFTASGGGLFKQSDIIISDKEPREGTYYIAVDPAGYGETKELTKAQTKHLDETAIAVVKVHDGGWWVKEIDSGRWGIREASLRILRHAQKVGAMSVGIEKGSLKNAIMPYLEDQMRRLGVFPHIEALTHGNQKKVERIVWALQGRFENHRVVLNEGTWTNKFIDQLLDMPNPLSHDDLPDALAYIDQIARPNYAQLIDEDEWEPLDIIAGW